MLDESFKMLPNIVFLVVYSICFYLLNTDINGDCFATEGNLTPLFEHPNNSSEGGVNWSLIQKYTEAKQ